MKRLPLLLVAAMALLLAACSEPPPSPELQGQWSGAASATQGVTVPLSFTVAPNGEVATGSFDASYESEQFSFSVSSTASADRLQVTATASNSLGDSLEFVLDGRVVGDELKGEFRLTALVNGERSELQGSFTLTRVTT